MSISYIFHFRKKWLSVLDTHQFPAVKFSNGNYQSRPPYVVHFQYSYYSSLFPFLVMPVHTIPDDSSTHTTQEEINSLRGNLYTLLNFPCCTGTSAIILGDFNQVPRYVLSNWRSALDEDEFIKEVMYEGSSSALSTNSEHRLDRYCKMHCRTLRSPLSICTPKANFLIMQIWYPIATHEDTVDCVCHAGCMYMVNSLELPLAQQECWVIYLQRYFVLNSMPIIWVIFCLQSVSDHYPIYFEIDTSIFAQTGRGLSSKI